MAPSNHAVVDYQTLKEFAWPLRQKTTKDTCFTKKNSKFYQKIAKTRDIKMLKSSSLPLQCRYNAVTFYQTLKKIPWPLRLEKRNKRQKISKKVEKNCKFYQKLAEFRDVKMLKNLAIALEIMQ